MLYEMLVQMMANGMQNTFQAVANVMQNGMQKTFQDWKLHGCCAQVMMALQSKW